MNSEDTEVCVDDNEGDIPGDIFPFETESMALKGNVDFIKLQRCLVLLESMRTQALKDIDKLLELQDEALADPSAFVSKLANGIDIGIPLRLDIPEVPEIDWNRYKIQVPLDAFKPATRTKPTTIRFEKDVNMKTDGVMVRGRLKDVSKPSTFNKLWTTEEQLKLEELLIKYPPGDNEARRFAKIAQELGTRTVKQVTSRCQKFFKKLHNAGMPVPGRPPRMRTSDSYRQLRAQRMALQKSTFFPRCLPPVPLREDGDLPGTSSVEISIIKEEPIDLEDEQELPEEARNTDEFRKLKLIKRVKRNMEMYGENDSLSHPGFKCDICEEDPLRGTRWHCVDCQDEESIDMCSCCLIAQLEGDDPHDLTHRWLACRPLIGGQGDKDYNYSSHYNYLDPNFQPD